MAPCAQPRFSPKPPSPRTKPTTVDGFNSLPAVLRQGRRKSSLELQLMQILDDSTKLRVSTFELRRKQQQELLRAETIVRNCSSMHKGALQVMHAVRFANKLTKPETAAETKAARIAEQKLAAKARVRADLAKLQEMIDGAKMNAAMQMTRELWTKMLNGKIAQMLWHWGNKVVDSYTVDECVDCTLVLSCGHDGEGLEEQLYVSEDEDESKERYLCAMEAEGMSTGGGSTGGGSTDGGSIDGGSPDCSPTGGGSTDGGSTGGGSTGGGSTDGGSIDGGSIDGGSPDCSPTGGESTDGGSTGGGSTDSGSKGAFFPLLQHEQSVSQELTAAEMEGLTPSPPRQPASHRHQRGR